MKLWETLKNKWLGLKRDERDIFALMIFALIVIPLQALQPPEWVEYVLIGLFGLYVVFSSPKIEEAGKEQESTLDKALKETHRQLNDPVKGVEALDEYFKKNPYKHPKGKLKSRKGK